MTENNIPTCERCGTPMKAHQVLLAWVCPLPQSACQSIAALRSEVEALRKRNEELEQELGDEKIEKIRLLNVATEARQDMFHAQEKHDQLLRAGGVLGESHLELLARKNKILAKLTDAESRAQELETKLRAAEDARKEAADAAVVLTKNSAEAIRRIRSSSLHSSFELAAKEVDAAEEILKTPFDIAVLAAQRKREIQREAVEAAAQRVIRLGPLSNQTPEGILAAILGNTEPA